MAQVVGASCASVLGLLYTIFSWFTWLFRSKHQANALYALQIKACGIKGLYMFLSYDTMRPAKAIHAKQVKVRGIRELYIFLT